MKISEFARKSMGQNKSAIVIIALASVLICTVINLGFCIKQALIAEIVELAGDNQARYKNITQEQADVISKREEIALADMHLDLNGYGTPVGDPDAVIGMSYSSGLGKVAGFKIDKGKKPEAEYEAVIAPHTAELFGIEAKTGAEFDIVYRTYDGEEIPLRLTVSGVLQKQRMYAAMDTNLIFVSKQLAERLEHSNNLYVRFKTKYNPRQTALKLAETVGLSEDDVNFNEQYLSANFDDPSVLLLVTAVLLILCAAGALAVFNAYNLSVVRRIHQYGLLTVIGASKKQIRRCVHIEALYSTAIGLPAGLLAGTLLGWVGMTAINRAMDEPMPYTVTPLAYLLSLLVTVLMVYISVRRPARKAARITPVEAVRFSDAAEKVKRRKTVTNVSLKALAKINMSRSKKRLIGTVLSLSMSGIMFVGFSTVAFSMTDSADTLAGQIVAGDIVITAERIVNSYVAGGENEDSDDSEISDPISRELTEKIRGIDGVNKVTSVMEQGLCEVRTLGSEDIPEFRGSVVGLEEEDFQKIIDKVYEGNISLDDFRGPENAGKVIAATPNKEAIEYYTKMDGINFAAIMEDYSVGNTVEHTVTNQKGWFTDKTASLRIAGLACYDDIPAYADINSMSPNLFTLTDQFPALGFDTSYYRLILDVDEDKHEYVYNVLENLVKDFGGGSDCHIESFKKIKDELMRQVTAVMAIVFLVLFVVALNGVLNLVTATFMGIEQRKKELGVLMAVGLSRKAVVRMLTREGLFVSALSAVLSTVLGLALGIGLYMSIVNVGATYLHFVFPVIPLIALCTMLGLLSYTVTLLAVKRLNRFTVVELLGRQM